MFFTQEINILIVEDDEINQSICVNLLQQKGWNSYIASNGYKALEIFKKHSLNIILMDVVMPEMDGYKTTFMIRHIESKIRKYIPIIAVSATSSKEKCIKIGMDDYISKPINIKNFYRTIEKFL